MDLTVSDQVLLRRFSEKGDEDAFSEIVRRYAALVYSTSRRVVGDRFRAEDVAQETFLRLLRKPRAVTSSLPGWLHKAATQLAIDTLRSDSSRRRREATHQLLEQPEASWTEISPHVDEALADLPEEARTLLVQHFLNGASQHELARQRGVSTATVCRRLQQALEQLRGQLRGKGIVISAAILAECLALDTVEAAPDSLHLELGKMSMISGLHLPPGAGRVVVSDAPCGCEHEGWREMLTAAVCAAAGAGLLACMLWSFDRHVLRPLRDHPAPTLEQRMDAAHATPRPRPQR